MSDPSVPLRLGDLRWLWGPAAPVPSAVAVGVAALLLALGVLMAAVPSAWWAFVVGLIMAVSALIVFGRKEAVARGIRSRDDTPKGLA
ncbi:MAG: hypothetical protein ACHQCH_00520 [Solirubrobacterales bacterium]